MGFQLQGLSSTQHGGWHVALNSGCTAGRKVGHPRRFRFLIVKMKSRPFFVSAAPGHREDSVFCRSLTQPRGSRELSWAQIQPQGHYEGWRKERGSLQFLFSACHVPGKFTSIVSRHLPHSSDIRITVPSPTRKAKIQDGSRTWPRSLKPAGSGRSATFLQVRALWPAPPPPGEALRRLLRLRSSRGSRGGGRNPAKRVPRNPGSPARPHAGAPRRSHSRKLRSFRAIRGAPRRGGYAVGAAGLRCCGRRGPGVGSKAGTQFT